MTRRARRTRALFRLRAAALLALCGSALAAAIAACGLDSIGSHPGPTPEVDATPAPTASLPPDNDAELPDGGGDGTVQSRCPVGLPGPTLVYVPSEAGTGPFCIDSTEVTRGDYETFLEKVGDGGIDAALDGGDGVDPAVFTACKPNQSLSPKGDAAPGVPVTDVTWCSAYAYCHWAGKHLCSGDVDGGEWMRACTRDGTRPLPYGDAQAPGACNVNNAVVGLSEAGSHPQCEGGFDGIFDMVGNAAEFVDDCQVDCRAAGGSYLVVSPACDWSAPVSHASGTLPTFGFRCCASATP